MFVSLKSKILTNKNLEGFNSAYISFLNDQYNKIRPRYLNYESKIVLDFRDHRLREQKGEKSAFSYPLETQARIKEMLALSEISMATGDIEVGFAEVILSDGTILPSQFFTSFDFSSIHGATIRSAINWVLKEAQGKTIGIRIFHNHPGNDYLANGLSLEDMMFAHSTFNWVNSKGHFSAFAEIIAVPNQLQSEGTVFSYSVSPMLNKPFR